MSYFRSGDPLDDFYRKDREEAEALEQLPICECGKRIDEDYYFEIETEILCEACMISRYRRNTNDY